MLRITLPKRTGLKRKRGSNEPYHQATSHAGPSAQDGRRHQTSSPLVKDTRSLLRSLRDNPSNHQVEVIGTINQTHRFRTLPDFVQSSTESPFMQKMIDTILPFDYAKLKKFTFDMSKDPKPNTEIMSPPSWSNMSVPINYAYRQNPGVKSTIDGHGNIITRNMQVVPKIYAQSIPFNATTVPTGPSSALPPISSLEPTLQRLIATANTLLETRPIFTRRSLPNCIPSQEWHSVGLNVTKFLYQYLGYIFASGPWRDAIVKFGIDPRTDPKYRIYQTMMFVVDTEPKDSRAEYKRKMTTTSSKREKTGQELRKESHLFDGENMSRDGKLWQVCDITDPLLKDILATQNLREKCHLESDGWYHNGTWAKAKTIMKWKINTILTGTVLLTDYHFARIATDMPDIINRSEKMNARLRYEKPSAEEKTLAAQIRTASTQYQVNREHQLVARDSYAGVEGEGEVDEQGILGGGEAEGPDSEEEDEGKEIDEDYGFVPMDGVIEPNLEDPRVLEAMREISKLGDRAVQAEGMEDDMGMEAHTSTGEKNADDA